MKAKRRKQKFVRSLRFFQEYGFHLPDQYLRRMSGTRELWELRAKYSGRQYHLFIAKIENDTAILLHAIIKKKQKTPQQDIQTAEERFKLVLQAQKGEK